MDFADVGLYVFTTGEQLIPVNWVARQIHDRYRPIAHAPVPDRPRPRQRAEVPERPRPRQPEEPKCPGWAIPRERPAPPSNRQLATQLGLVMLVFVIGMAIVALAT